MKRKLIICSSLITLLLACFSFPIYAETTTHDDAGSTPISSDIQLDSYFYQNYDLLPYIESDANQYINTGINGKSDLKIQYVFSDIYLNPESSYNIGLFGSQIGYNNDSLINYIQQAQNNRYIFTYLNASYGIYINLDPYVKHNILMDRNELYVDSEYINSLNYSEFNNNLPMFIFAQNYNGTATSFSYFKLYSLSIYDYDSDSYVRYYYPARSKSSGSIGLYDSVSKIFFTSASTAIFDNPTNEYVENFQISSFLTNSLTWIGQILEAIIEIPIIVIFIAIGLAGAMFRWGRRIVHF